MPTYEPIQTIVSNGSTSSFDFTSIPQTYTDLRVIVSGTCNASGNDFRMRFNSSNNYYSFTWVASSNGTSTGTGFSGANAGYIAGYQITGNTTTPFMFIYDINGYAETGNYKSVTVQNNTVTSDMLILAGSWQQTTAISRITCGPEGNNANFTMVAGSSATLYGIKAA
jgi:hypothetical protein